MCLKQKDLKLYNCFFDVALVSLIFRLVYICVHTYVIYIWYYIFEGTLSNWRSTSTRVWITLIWFSLLRDVSIYSKDNVRINIIYYTSRSILFFNYNRNVHTFICIISQFKVYIIHRFIKRMRYVNRYELWQFF